MAGECARAHIYVFSEFSKLVVRDVVAASPSTLHVLSDRSQNGLNNMYFGDDLPLMCVRHSIADKLWLLSGSFSVSRDNSKMNYYVTFRLLFHGIHSQFVWNERCAVSNGIGDFIFFLFCDKIKTISPERQTTESERRKKCLFNFVFYCWWFG